MAAQIDSNVQPAKSQALPDLPALDGKCLVFLPHSALYTTGKDIQVRALCAIYADTYQDKVKFTPYANWLIPGHLMVGRYPYVEPSRCP